MSPRQKRALDSRSRHRARTEAGRSETQGRTPAMNRRLSVALAATAALGLSAAGVASTAGAAHPEEPDPHRRWQACSSPASASRIDLRFKPRDIDRQVGLDRHASSTRPRRASRTRSRSWRSSTCPTSFESAVDAKLFGGPPGRPDQRGGAARRRSSSTTAWRSRRAATLAVDTASPRRSRGDSRVHRPGPDAFSFKVTAAKGSHLFYYCAIHPWMQGKLTVN